MDKDVPFQFLFERSPAEFAALFENEARQTRVFLLSFAPDSEYVESVVDIYNDEQFTDLAIDYLSRVERESVNMTFVHNVEQWIMDIFREDKSIVMGLRKNMTLRSRKEAE